jgi:hypothetical protein
MEVKGEQPSHSQNEVDSWRKIKKMEDKHTALSKNAVDYMKIIKNLVDRHTSHCPNEVDSVKIMKKVQDRHTANSQNALDSVKTMEVEGEHLAHSPNEVGTAKIMKLAEETVSDPAYMESPVKMGRPRKNCFVASKATGEKKKADPKNKVEVDLAPPPNLKAVSCSNPIHRAGENRVKIHNEELDYSKVEGKVKLTRKMSLQSDGGKSLQHK